MKLTDNIYYIGVNDYNIDLFEGQYRVENGMAYNSYLILDEKIAVLDSVEKSFGEEWLNNIADVLGDKSPDFLVVHHMEPDHSANIHKFIEKYPSARIVSSEKSFVMMKQFFGNDYKENQVIVTDGDILELGTHKLTFITAPMVHWPEVIVSYEENTKTLFSADAFGKFGTTDADEDWTCEARRYYFGIVGKYGPQVQALFKKIADLSIDRICSLHGPVLSENLNYYLNLYNIWSSYDVESEGVAIFYTSVYGNTKKAAESLADQLSKKGCQKVVLNDLARCDMAEAVEDAFRYSKLVLATTTYNADIFPFMREFINHLTERGFKKRKIGFIENGSWAPMAAKIMREKLEKSKNLEFCEQTVCVLSALNDKNLKELELLADELC